MYVVSDYTGALATQDVGHCPGAPVNERGTQQTCSELKESPIVPTKFLKKDAMKIDRRAVYDKYDGHCAYCGEEIEFKSMQVDHIRPKSMFNVGYVGNIPKYHVDDLQNLNPTCRVCNYWKHNYSVDKFRKEILQQVDRLRRDSGKFRFAERYELILETNTFHLFYFERTP